MTPTRKHLLASLAVSAGLAGLAGGATDAAAASKRPDFRLPFACGADISLTTYVGHNPDDKKIDMFRKGMPKNSPILASAAGKVHEAFAPGGIEIDHGKGWFTTYMHMKSHVDVGTKVKQGQRIGTMGKVGTGVVHLHYEQLHNPGSHDADNEDIVNPLLQGQGPLVMDPNHALTMRSTNACRGSAPAPTPAPAPAPAPSPAPSPSPAPATPTKYWVTTFENAPGRATPGGKQTGTLNKGRNYVFCKVAGPNVKAGSDHNRFWLKTDLDVGPAGQYVSAYYLSKWGNDEAKDDKGRVIPDC